MSRPVYPSSKTFSPVSSFSVTSCKPTIAGISRERAMIAVCEVRLPKSVAMPSARAIHRSGIGRRKIVRDKNVRLGNSEKRFRRFALQIANHPLGHILNIERALPQIRIVDLAQRLGIAGGDFLKDPLNVAKVALQFAQHFID